MKEKYYLIALIIVLSLSIVVLINIQNPSEGFSKVYFENLTVPEYIIPNKTYTMMFVIESHELYPVNYSFEVYVNDELIKQGKVAVNPGQRNEIPFEFSISKVSYEKVVLTHEQNIYFVNGLSLIVGNILRFQNLMSNMSADELLYLINHTPVMYDGSNNLTFILDVSRNISITQTRIIKNSAKIKEVYQFNMSKVGDESYKVVTSFLKTKYIPEPVIMKVVVKSSTGKVYQLSATIEVKGEK
ncbi:hypothetical protein [Thermococcus barophilus]|uniref:Uncharacterized protein n=1 Tax=Thermococcus barophilus (strain DSM 11836 / MP) TaxID=391623 RepID=F0LM02_THEBM|nr:hypothetical protein [Thermococcus barophilus]ADT85101.1 hypothetical protein TERMP_02127 [Thermococcus barophilus MP]